MDHDLSGVHAWRHYDQEERRKWQDPDAILNGIGLKPNHIFIDIGCGDGYFAIPAARMVGKEGKVYGLDIDPEAIASLQAKAKQAELDNLELKVAGAEETVLCNQCGDFAFFGTVLHDFWNADKVLQNAWQMLKPEGKLVDLDFKKIEMSFGPPVQKRLSETDAARHIEAAGFKIESIQESGRYHYLIIAAKA